MKFDLKKYLVALAAFLVIDGIWIAVTTESLYREQLGEIMAEEPILWPAAIFYLLFVYGVVHFALEPGLAKKSLKLAVQNGAWFGFLAYTTYAMTNLAVIEDWPLGTALIDMVWGGVLAGSVAAVSYKFLTRNGN